MDTYDDSRYNPYTAGHGGPNYKRLRNFWTVWTVIVCVGLSILWYRSSAASCDRLSADSSTSSSLELTIAPPFLTCNLYDTPAVEPA